jgi:hypothetical protein
MCSPYQVTLLCLQPWEIRDMQDGNHPFPSVVRRSLCPRNLHLLMEIHHATALKMSLKANLMPNILTDRLWIAPFF